MDQDLRVIIRSLCLSCLHQGLQLQLADYQPHRGKEQLAAAGQKMRANLGTNKVRVQD